MFFVRDHISAFTQQGYKLHLQNYRQRLAAASRTRRLNLSMLPGKEDESAEPVRPDAVAPMLNLRPRSAPVVR